MPTMRPTAGIGYLTRSQTGLLLRLPGRPTETTSALIYLEERTDLGDAPILASPVAWNCGHSLGSLTYSGATVSATGSGYSDFIGDQWQIYHKRSGGNVSFLTSAAAAGGGEILSLGPLNMTWASGDAVGVAWFSTNGGAVPTYVRYSGAFIVFKVYAYRLEPSASYSVRVRIKRSTFAGGTPTYESKQYVFLATHTSHSIIYQYALPSLSFTATLMAVPFTVTIHD